MVPIEDVLLWAIAQRGDRYVFGAEASPLDPDPKAFDCSELVEWASARAGVTPKVPDGAYNQWLHCRLQKTELTVTAALALRGALLFVGDGTGVGRQAITHVAISLGDGTTVEARGRLWGVGTWATKGRTWNYGARIPGVDYSPAPIEENPMLAAAALIADTYRAVAHREPDPAGLAHWIPRFVAATRLNATAVANELAALTAALAGEPR